MADRLGWPFTPKVAYLYNGSPTAIAIGETVIFYSSSSVMTTFNMEWPEPDINGGGRTTLYSTQVRSYGTTLAVPTIARCTAAPTGTQSVLGVAMEAISATSWGHVCLEGVCDVRIATARHCSLGAALIATAEGCFLDNSSAGICATSATIRAVALEACETSSGATSATIGMIRALFLPGNGHQVLGLSTAG